MNSPLLSSLPPDSPSTPSHTDCTVFLVITHHQSQSFLYLFEEEPHCFQRALFVIRNILQVTLFFGDNYTKHHHSRANHHNTTSFVSIKPDRIPSKTRRTRSKRRLSRRKRQNQPTTSSGGSQNSINAVKKSIKINHDRERMASH